jgi:bifunctional DNA-binding transcriptional regulator/antitoxin component of YhaV-PrlF toxin-antitoxin module
MEVDATDGRIYLPKELREKYGDQFRLVERGEQLVLLPVSEDPLAALREEFADVDKSVEDLRDDARSSAIEDAGE